MEKREHITGNLANLQIQLQNIETPIDAKIIDGDTARYGGLRKLDYHENEIQQCLN